MKLSLSTNWCNRQITDGAEIAEKALALGFDELELGFRTSYEQVPGFKAMLSKIPVGSIHAFCPIPLSAPYGHPELFQLASFAPGERALAKAHVANNIRFAAEIGADTIVLHAGRVAFSSLFRVMDSSVLRASLAKAGNKSDDAKYSKLLARAQAVRRKRGAKLLEAFKAELEGLVKILEDAHVTLAFENLPYLEGFPDEVEVADVVKHFNSSAIRAWFDTGHHRVRRMHGWIGDDSFIADTSIFAGMHLNDVVDFTDDHFAPGQGKVDFAALTPLMQSVRHIVFEPNSTVTEDALRSGIKLIRKLKS